MAIRQDLVQDTATHIDHLYQSTAWQFLILDLINEGRRYRTYGDANRSEVLPATNLLTECSLLNQETVFLAALRNIFLFSCWKHNKNRLGSTWDSFFCHSLPLSGFTEPVQADQLITPNAPVPTSLPLWGETSPAGATWRKVYSAGDAWASSVLS